MNICQLAALLLLIPTILSVVASPQIFSEVYESCQYEVNGKKLRIPNKVWKIENSQYSMHFSLCHDTASLQKVCRKRTSSCLVNKRNNLIIDSGELSLDDPADLTFRSKNGARCSENPSKNYTLTVYLECTNSPRAPRLQEVDDCEYEVRVMSPTCAPKCTGLVQGSHLIDLRRFPKDIQVKSQEKRFSITVCGPSTTCGDPSVSSCEILNDNSTVPLAKTESQLINFDVGKNELTARDSREFQLLIKCNWKTMASDVFYKKADGRKYKFEMESSFGCVKLPPDCFLITQDNLKYDLSGLNRASRPWELQTPQGRILMNVCGPLNLNSINDRRNECVDQYSQICELKTTNRQYINRGSIMKQLESVDDEIKMTFVSGSTCDKHPRELNRTEIMFSCSKTENGPIFESYSDCVTSLSWKTPRACPIDSYSGANCLVSNALGNWNLKNLRSFTDRIHPVSQNTEIFYNLCGALNSTCNGYSNASFCLRTKKKEHVIGWSSQDLQSENGTLKQKLNGPLCWNRRSLSKVDITFVCDYTNPPRSPEISVIEDNCQFTMTVYTSLACSTASYFPQCATEFGQFYYNLSALTLKNKNYIVQDPQDTNVEYILNVCGPLVTSSTSQCRGETMVCLRNKTESNSKKRFLSVGGISTPHFKNNTLRIEAKMGAFCPDLGQYESNITFVCSQREDGPKLIRKEKCVHTFLWRTIHACKIRNESTCEIPNTKSRFSSYLSKMEKTGISIKIDNGTNLNLDLCKDSYNSCDISSDSRCRNKSLVRSLFDTPNTTHLVFDLDESCERPNTDINKIVIQIICAPSQDEEHFEKIFRKNCTGTLLYYSSLACFNRNEKKREDEQRVNEVMKESYSKSISDRTISKAILSTSTSKTVSQASPRNTECPIVNQYTNYRFDLSRIQPPAATFENDEIFSNVQQTFSKKCPNIVYNYTGSYVKLLFDANDICAPGSNGYEFWLYCDQKSRASNDPRILKTEMCNIVIEYNIPEACLLLEKESVHSISTSSIVGGSFGFIMLLSGLILVTWLLKRKLNSSRRKEYVNLLPGLPKRSVPVYMKDAYL